MNGDAAVTDAHRLYLVSKIHERSDGAILTPTGKRVVGDFPDIYRLMPSRDPQQVVTLEVDELLLALDLICCVGSSVEETVLIDLIDDKIVYRSDYAVKGSYTLPVTFEVPMSFNAVYWLDAIKLLKEMRCNLITVSFFAKFQPITLVNETENIKIIILPIRKH